MSTDYGADNRHDDDLPSVDRLLALSDGVVAIALTLLVLQLAVPVIRDADSPSSLAAALGGRGDRLTSYAISFYVIAQFWLLHHKVYRRIVGQREGLAWWNFAFLFTITVMPFTSDLLGEYSENPLAVVIFAGNLLLATLATQATAIYAKRAGLLGPRPGLRSAVRTGWSAPRARDHPGRPGVHRPGLGEHRPGQVQLAADGARAGRGGTAGQTPAWLGGERAARSGVGSVGRRPRWSSSTSWSSGRAISPPSP